MILADSPPPRDVARRAQSLHERAHCVFSRDDASGGRSHTSKRNSILVVEDDYLIAMQVEYALNEAGFSVVGVAASAEEAIQLAGAFQPLLAVMDIRLLGRRDGIDAALDLFRSYNIRCIFASAHSDPDVIQRAGPAQPLAWLQKPYTMSSLISAVQKALIELQPKTP